METKIQQYKELVYRMSDTSSLSEENELNEQIMQLWFSMNSSEQAEIKAWMRSVGATDEAEETEIQE